jgi:lysophospholipase-2
MKVPVASARGFLVLFAFLPSWISTMSNSAVAATLSSASKSSKKGALIFLHGLGDTPAGWSSLEKMLPSIRPNLKDIAYVFPHAPTIPIAINGGATMPGWFDLFDWPIAVGSQDDKDGLLRGIKHIEEEVKKLNAYGIPASKIVVGGFSQGGAVSLLSCYSRSKEPFAGCAVLSAWLTLADELEISNQAQKSPLFWGHGRLDDKVLFEQQTFGVEKLKSRGVVVMDEAYNMGHSSHPEEMEDLADFVERILFPSDA